VAVIELAIQADDDEVRSDLDALPSTAPAAALEHTYFVVPTRLAVDGKDLLAFPGVYEAWRPLPLLGFAPRLRAVASALPDGQAATLSLADGGTLEFRRDGADVRIRASLTGDEVTVAAEHLADASVAFAREVCEYVLSIVPSMLAHGSWSMWCGDVQAGRQT
jgi:hypothetical protein